jgi:hypothetical protein
MNKIKLPPDVEFYEDIRNFEQYLTRNGVVVRKFFLHVSKKEQKRRFLDRIDDSLKNWKFSSNDAKERDFWDDYMEAYEEMIQETATKDAPWYVVPADNKWFTRKELVPADERRDPGLDRPHPFTAAGNTEFNCLLWLPPNDQRAGNIVMVDSTNFTTLFGGTDSLENFWRNLALMK